MKVLKVFNNSVVLGVDDTGTELVLLGRGVGFQAKPGDPVDPALVERTFVPDRSTTAERIAAFVQEIPRADIEVTEEIVTAARQRLGDHVTDHVLVPLADHVSFALRRVREGATEIDYPLRWEVENLYPNEVAFSREAVGIIERRTGVRLPESEAVPLALHFVNAQFGSAADIEVTVGMTEVLTQALAIICGEYDVVIDERSVVVARFVTHLRYLFRREQLGRQLPSIADGLHDAVRSAQPREYACGERIADLLAQRFGWEVGPEEVVYLTLHVARLTASAMAAAGGRTDG